MTDCKITSLNNQLCPVCGTECAGVSARTITHHIRHAWQWAEKPQRYCDNPDCEVAYFAEDGSVILKPQLRTAFKEVSGQAMLCYCFGISKADALSDPGIRDFVVAKTKLGLCSCETSNPSGRCCLKRFPLA